MQIGFKPLRTGFKSAPKESAAPLQNGGRGAISYFCLKLSKTILTLCFFLLKYIFDKEQTRICIYCYRCQEKE